MLSQKQNSKNKLSDQQAPDEMLISHHHLKKDHCHSAHKKTFYQCVSNILADGIQSLPQIQHSFGIKHQPLGQSPSHFLLLLQA